MLDGNSSHNDGNMVGLSCDKGLILATSSRDHLLYHLDDFIYCCAPRSSNYRERILDVGAQVDYLTRDQGQKVTVAQVRDMLCRKFNDFDNAQILLAGHDSSGPQIYNLKEYGRSDSLRYTAEGKQADDILSFLANNWTEHMKLVQAEQLARDSLELEENDYVDMCVIYKAEEREVSEEPESDMEPEEPESDMEPEEPQMELEEPQVELEEPEKDPEEPEKDPEEPEKDPEEPEKDPEEPDVEPEESDVEPEERHMESDDSSVEVVEPEPQDPIMVSDGEDGLHMKPKEAPLVPWVHIKTDESPVEPEERHMESDDSSVEVVEQEPEDPIMVSDGEDGPHMEPKEAPLVPRVHLKTEESPVEPAERHMEPDDSPVERVEPEPEDPIMVSEEGKVP